MSLLHRPKISENLNQPPHRKVKKKVIAAIYLSHPLPLLFVLFEVLLPPTKPSPHTNTLALPPTVVYYGNLISSALAALATSSSNSQQGGKSKSQQTAAAAAKAAMRSKNNDNGSKKGSGGSGGGPGFPGVGRRLGEDKDKQG